MNVFLANEQDVEVDESRLADLARHAMQAENLEEDAELSILLVGKNHIRRLNARYAGENEVTDVLAFPLNEEEDERDDEPLVLGDVVICPDVARENASRFNHGVADELEVLLVHGVLHLLGYDHQGPEDRSTMERRQREILDTYTAVA